MDLTQYEMIKNQQDWNEKYNKFIQSLMGGGELSPHLSDKSNAGLVALNGAKLNSDQSWYRYIDLGDLRLVDLKISFCIPESEQGKKDLFDCLQLPNNILPADTDNTNTSTDYLGTHYRISDGGVVALSRVNEDGLHSDWGYYTSFMYFAIKR